MQHFPVLFHSDILSEHHLMHCSVPLHLQEPLHHPASDCLWTEAHSSLLIPNPLPALRVTVQSSSLHVPVCRLFPWKPVSSGHRSACCTHLLQRQLLPDVPESHFRLSEAHQSEQSQRPLLLCLPFLS